MEHALEVLADDEALARRAAGFVAERARAAVADHGRFRFAVSGGHTPWAMFAELAGEEVPWSAVELFQVDERVAPDGDPDRNLTHLQPGARRRSGDGGADGGERARPRGGRRRLRRAPARSTSTSSTWASVPTATRRRSCPATPSSR